MPAILKRFNKLHQKSMALARDAASLFPDGVTHASRKMSPFPVYMDRGLGPRKWDVDGNEYIDYRTGHGSMILGQAHPAVVKAVQDRMAKGTHLSASTELEVRWAQTVKRLVPSVEQLRFVSSGTEALMMAFKIARAFTGKDKIVKFKGAFHGWSDPAYVTDPDTDRRYGIPKGTSDSVLQVPPGDLEAVERLLSSRSDIAAVVFQGNEIARPEFVKGLREATSRHRTILIFDEVVSGFRWSRAGCQGHYGVRPDLSGFAKILAGGLPGGAVGGRADLLAMIGEDGIRHPGTFNANPLSASAGVAALSIVEKEPIVERAEAAAARLKSGINRVLREMEIPGGAYGMSSIVMVSLGRDVDSDDPYATPAGTEQGGRPVTNEALDQLHIAIVNEGLWTHPASFILSATHTDRDIDLTVEKYRAGLREVRKAGLI
jgi:glutamate-1-semialdehyde 2,1-aminomutase